MKKRALSPTIRQIALEGNARTGVNQRLGSGAAAILLIRTVPSDTLTALSRWTASQNDWWTKSAKPAAKLSRETELSLGAPMGI